MKQRKQVHIRFLLLILISSLTAEESMAGASAALAGSTSVTESQTIRDFLYQKSQAQLGACPVETPSTLEERSERQVAKLFDSFACSSAGTDASSERLDLNYCTAVNDCKTFDTGNVAEKLDKDTREFLEHESMIYMIRENVKGEMEKYKSDKAEIFKGLLKYVDRMPENLKSKINTCARPKLPQADECIPNSQWDSVAKFYITDASANGLVDKAKVYHKKNTLEESHDESADSTNSMANQFKIAANSGTLAENFSNYAVGDDFYQSKFYNDLNDPKDSIVSFIMSEITNPSDPLAYTKWSPEELKERVIMAVVKSSSARTNLRDPIFNYRVNSSRIESDVRKAFMGVKFSAQDFTADQDQVVKGLLGKLNTARVVMANKYISESCGQFSTTIGQVCEDISKNMGTGHVVDIFSKDSLPLESILDYYKKSNAPDREAKIAKLTNMINAKDRIYQKYLTYMMEKTTCQEKFKDNFLFQSTRGSAAKIAADKREAKKRLDEEMEKAYQQEHQEKQKELSDILINNTSLQSDMKQAGFKASDFKVDSSRDSLLINTTPAANKTTDGLSGVRSDDYASMTKGIQDQSAAIATHPQQVTRSFDNTINSSDMFDTNAAAKVVDKKSRDDDDVNAQLRARLAQLEGKEKSLSKKMTDSGESAASANSDELQSLRQQIEDLKNLQTKNAKAKSDAIAKMDAPKDSSDSSRDSGNDATISTNSRSNRSDDSGSDDSASVAAHNSSAIASANSDYASVSGNAASRSVAATAAVGGKGTSEKSGNGIMLTKSGDVMIDPSSIMDNPNEVDIVNTLELSQGRPFLIRENGVLMKVSLELDSKGKPKMNNGKFAYIKTKLTKEQERTVAQEAVNIQKVVKEVGSEPVRLYNLKTLLDSKVKAAQ